MRGLDHSFNLAAAASAAPCGCSPPPRTPAPRGRLNKLQPSLIQPPPTVELNHKGRLTTWRVPGNNQTQTITRSQPRGPARRPPAPAAAAAAHTSARSRWSEGAAQEVNSRATAATVVFGNLREVCRRGWAGGARRRDGTSRSRGIQLVQYQPHRQRGRGGIGPRGAPGQRPPTQSPAPPAALGSPVCSWQAAARPRQGGAPAAAPRRRRRRRRPPPLPPGPAGAQRRGLRWRWQRPRRSAPGLAGPCGPGQGAPPRGLRFTRVGRAGQRLFCLCDARVCKEGQPWPLGGLARVVNNRARRAHGWLLGSWAAQSLPACCAAAPPLLHPLFSPQRPQRSFDPC